ncbi:MAG: NYN domain-containing protein [Candidatus Woesearchaeota archaeon]
MENHTLSIKERIIIFVDARNIISSQKNYNILNKKSVIVGYPELIDYFSKDNSFIRGYYYDSAPHKNHLTKERKKFFAFLRNNGFTLRLKELDFNNNHVSQKGVDIFLTADMISLAYENAYDIALIVSGDGDYVALIDLVKSKGKKVWVLSFKSSLSDKLRDCADKVFVIDNMIGTLQKRA